MTDVLYIYIYIGIAHVLLVYVGLAQARPNHVHSMNELQILLGSNCNGVLAASCIYNFLYLQAMLAHHVLQHACYCHNGNKVNKKCSY